MSGAVKPAALYLRGPSDATRSLSSFLRNAASFVGRAPRRSPQPQTMSKPEETPPLAITIRPAKPEDLPYILNRWKFSLQQYSPELKRSDYLALMNLICDEVLAGSPAVFVACSPADEDVLFGFVVAEETPKALLLWMAYAEDGYRTQKVASRLIAHAFDKLNEAGPETFYCPHQTKLDSWLQTRLGAGHLHYRAALRMRRDHA